MAGCHDCVAKTNTQLMNGHHTHDTMMEGSGWTRRAAGSRLDVTTTTGSAGAAAAVVAGPQHVDEESDASSSDMAVTSESELACEMATAIDCARMKWQRENQSGEFQRAY